MEGLARAKLQQIQVAREQQIQEKLQHITAARSRGEAETEWRKQVKEEFDGIEDELAEAFRAEKEYERCDYRRTSCKALQSLIEKHNQLKQMHRAPSMQYMHSWEGYRETAGCKKFVFDHYGAVSAEKEFLVDPESFFPYDLVRSRSYSERPL